MVIYPENSTLEKKKLNETILCYAYDSDLVQVYDFYCARYENISFNDFLNKGINEVQRKLMSIPESEPLYTIIKSRVINVNKIKNKDERKYWSELKEAYKIPDIYKPSQELDINLKAKLGGFNGKRFM